MFKHRSKAFFRFLQFLSGAFFKCCFGPFTLFYFLLKKLVCLTQLGGPLGNLGFQIRILFTDRAEPPPESGCDQPAEQNKEGRIQ